MGQRVRIRCSDRFSMLGNIRPLPDGPGHGMVRSILSQHSGRRLVENVYSSCIRNDDISSLDPHQHIPETTHLTGQLRHITENGVHF